jgi:hypothetical protein
MAFRWLRAQVYAARMSRHANRREDSRRPKSLEGFTFGDGKAFANIVDAG